MELNYFEIPDPYHLCLPFINEKQLNKAYWNCKHANAIVQLDFMEQGLINNYSNQKKILSEIHCSVRFEENL